MGQEIKQNVVSLEPLSLLFGGLGLVTYSWALVAKEAETER